MRSLTPLPSTDLRFALQADRVPDLPFLGPTIRGMLGHGLRRVACGHGGEASSVARCPAGARCAYARIFEGASERLRLVDGAEAASPPPPMVIEVAGPDATDPHRVEFCVRLFGTAIRDASAVVEAVAERQSAGLGARGNWFELISLERSDENALKGAGESGSMTILDALDSVGPAEIQAVRFDLHSPTSIRGRSGCASLIDPIALVHAARRRDWFMRRVHGLEDHGSIGSARAPSAPDPASFHVTAECASVFKLSRRCGRQGGAMPMQGVVGSIVIEGAWKREPWLVDVERLHIGKYAAFGFGAVSVTALTEPPTASMSPPRDDPACAIAVEPDCWCDAPERSGCGDQRWKEGC